MPTATELRLQSRNDRLELVQRKHNALLAERGDGNLSDTDKSQIEEWRVEQADLATEIEGLLRDKEAHDRAVEQSKIIRRATADGLGVDESGPIYREFVEYARDEILARSLTSTGELAKVASQWGGEQAAIAARERLQLMKRDVANTLSSNVEGLQPDQHIAQIFQIINTERPIVASAQRTTLERLTLTYPSVTTRPVVAVQASEKTQGGNTGMVIDMETTTATTYHGGGDISWQAAQFSTPSALDLWFRFVTEDYAIKTEADAATVISADAFLNQVSSPLGATPTFADFMTAVGKGGAEVYSNTRRMANTVYMAPDRYWYLFGTTSEAAAQFTTVTGDGVGPLRFISSPGLNSGEIIVGDSKGLLVAENAGAPVELRVVEPAIGGFEVGLIGAFEAVVVDPGAFASITTAS